MKKVLLLLAMIAFTFNAFAQEEEKVIPDGPKTELAISLDWSLGNTNLGTGAEYSIQAIAPHGFTFGLGYYRFYGLEDRDDEACCLQHYDEGGAVVTFGYTSKKDFGIIANVKTYVGGDPTLGFELGYRLGWFAPKVNWNSRFGAGLGTTIIF